MASYKADCQDGNVRYLNSLNHARAYAYWKFKDTKRELPIVIYSPKGKRSGFVRRNPKGGIEWVTFSPSKGSIHKRLYEDGRA